MTSDRRPPARLVARFRGTWLSSGVPRDLFAAQLVSAVASLAVNVMSARGMGPAGRGVLAFFLQLIYVGSAVCMLGADRALPAVHRDPPTLRTAEGEILRLAVPAGIVTSAAVLAWVVWSAGDGRLDPWSGPSALAFALALWGNICLLALRAAAITAQQTSRFLAIMIAGQVSLVLGALVLFLLSVRAPEVWLALYGGAFVIPAAVALAARRPARPDQPRSALRVARRLGLRLTPMVLANMVMLRSDRIILPLLGDVSQLGFYIVVATITELLWWPVQNYVDARIPPWRARLARGDLSVGEAFLVVGAYAGGAAVLVAVALHVLLVPVFGSQYGESRSLIWPLAVAAGLYAVSRVGAAVCIAANRAGSANLIDLAGMVVAVPAYLLLIPEGGASGAARGTLLAYGAAALVSAAVSWRVAGRLRAAGFPAGGTPR